MVAQPLAQYALEQLRQRFLYSACTSRLMTDGAKVAVQMAFETQAGVVIVKLAAPPPSVLEMPVTTRRRYLDVDADMQNYKFLYEPALADLVSLAPSEYVDFVRRLLGADYARYRMSATAAMLCLAAAI